MILKPYREVFSLHDSKIFDINRRERDLEISLSSMVIFENGKTFAIDNPKIICHDLIDIEANMDYPVRILAFEKNPINLSLDEFKDYTFDIIEEAYGQGLIHFYGIGNTYKDGKPSTYDMSIDIFYRGELEAIWDRKDQVEIKG
ncbi:hypothetical protein [uncultured Anaerococcus sp.]|uniref:hypothetical protein n=1 Tax=uncultured Anaerococcus sp. TaxID=293428 RepID=UPI00288AEEDD|nr:hypothetical protein [uncultured Anaerococcus sp.]